MKGPNKSELEDIHLPTLQMFTGDLRGSRRFSHAISMEEGCRNRREILYLIFVIFTDYGENPMITIGFPRNLQILQGFPHNIHHL